MIFSHLLQRFFQNSLLFGTWHLALGTVVWVAYYIRWHSRCEYRVLTVWVVQISCNIPKRQKLYIYIFEANLTYPILITILHIEKKVTNKYIKKIMLRLKQQKKPIKWSSELWTTDMATWILQTFRNNLSFFCLLFYLYHKDLYRFYGMIIIYLVKK